MVEHPVVAQGQAAAAQAGQAPGGERAVATFHAGFNCAQAVFSALSPELGMERELALRVAGAFGAGTARMASTCGAVSGALMALGLKYGQVQGNDQAAKETTYAAAGQFLSRFRERHGSVLCRDLLGVDLSSPEGHQQARAAGLFKSVCPRLVADAAEIAEDLL